jgi:predicted nucleic acid-binding Zn finger protein
MEDRHVAILLEEMRGQFKAFGEALQGTNDNIAVMGEKIAVMDGKIAVMDGRIAVMDGKIAVMDGKIAVMDGKIAVMDGKIDRLSVDMVDVKTRLTRVERAVTNGARKKRKS